MEPSHYAGTDAIAKQEAVAARLVGMGVPAGMAFCAATALKYVERCGRKEGASAADDMEKAANYLFRAISGRWPWEDAVEADHVLAADGLPLREGEHVYHVETGAELVVKELPKPGAYQAVVVFAPPASHLMMSFDPDRITHQRLAPKVLDADGVEIRVGDTVYHVKDGSEMTVYEIEGEWLVVSVGGRVRHDIVTHRAPVLAADGKPLREGETVWHKSGLACGVVETIDAGSLMHTTRYRGDDGTVYRDAAKDLVHKRPDSWELLEEDVGKEACEYFAHMPCGCETSEMLDETVEKCNAAKARDIVRRARALAERGQ